VSCPGAAAEPLGVPGQQRQVTHEHVERTRDHRPAEWERGRETARRGRSRLASVSGHVRTRVTAIVKRQSTRGREDMAVKYDGVRVGAMNRRGASRSSRVCCRSSRR
jgi:hypothetical protein